MAEADSSAEEQWYRVCLNTIVRSGEQLDSERLRILPMGSRVCVVEKKTNSRRVRIKSPIKGWCSMSSSNGDTILAPIESPNEVPNTPRDMHGKVKALQDRKKKTEDMLKNKDDPKYKGKVNEAELKQQLDYNEARLKELQNIENVRNEQYQIAEQESSKKAKHADGKYFNNEIVMTKQGIVGVVRWLGKGMEGEDLVGVEVQKECGDCDGTYKDGSRHFEVNALSGVYILEDSIKQSLSPIDILSRLESTIAELASYRSTYNRLAKVVGEKAPELLKEVEDGE